VLRPDSVLRDFLEGRMMGKVKRTKETAVDQSISNI